MGDFNAKVGRREPSAMSSAVGLYGLGETNKASGQLEDFCLEHELALANTMFKQHPRRLYTWTSPDGNTRNQITQRWKTSLMNCRTYPGADCRSSVARGWLKGQRQHTIRLWSRGTQGRQSSTVCCRGDQQVYGIGGCTEWGHPRRSLERYQDSPAGNAEKRLDPSSRKEKEMDIWWDLRSNQGKREKQKAKIRTVIKSWRQRYKESSKRINSSSWKACAWN